MFKEDMFVSYLEDKYDETFSYIEPTGGQIGGTSSEAWLKSTRFPDERILAARYMGADGKYRFYDNYMAILLHDDAETVIKEILNGVFDDYKLYFPIPMVVLRDGDKGYCLSDYLKDPGADLQIIIFAFSNTEKNMVNHIAEAFGSHEIAVHVQLIFTGENFEGSRINEDNIEKYYLTDEWYDGKVTFSIENDGVISFEKWR